MAIYAGAGRNQRPAPERSPAAVHRPAGASHRVIRPGKANAYRAKRGRPVVSLDRNRPAVSPWRGEARGRHGLVPRISLAISRREGVAAIYGRPLTGAYPRMARKRAPRWCGHARPPRGYLLMTLVPLPRAQYPHKRTCTLARSEVRANRARSARAEIVYIP